MKLTLHSFRYDVPLEKVCQPGVDYEVFESQVEPEQVLHFLNSLVLPRDSFHLDAATDYLVDFWKHEQSVWVEITCKTFWATSEVSIDEARAIIDCLHRGESFGNCIPATEREWDAYTSS